MRNKIAYVFMRELSISDTFSISDLRNLKRENIKISVLSILKKKRQNPSFFDEGISFYQPNTRSLLNIVRCPFIFIDALIFVLKANKFDFKNLIKNLYIIPSSIQVLKNLKEIKPKVVHLFWGHYPSLVGYLVLKHLKESKLSMFLGAYDVHTNNPLTKIVGNRSHFLITHSSSNISLIKEKIGINRNIEVIERGVDTEYLNINEKKITRCHKSMVYAGRLIKDKNIETVIDVYSESQKLFPYLKLDIYGDGDRKNFLLQYAKKVSPNGVINFHGEVNQKILAKKLRQANIFVFTSVKKGEVLPNALKEAMFAGCVCITTYTPGIEMLIDDRINGFIENNSVLEISSRIRKILSYDDKRLKFIRSMAQKKIHNDFSAIDSMNKYIKLWEINTHS
ncbi:glycosyltransferase family 4 protein [Gammaproteobacteria bacterium]|nr:glycosyltransferase family 4 protein [Gammaproteobacteria bacterium]